MSAGNAAPLSELEPTQAGATPPASAPRRYRAWVTRAACAGRSWLFDGDVLDHAQALAICRACPVLLECRQWALHNAVDGVAGGLTAAARMTWRRKRRIAEPLVTLDDFLDVEVACEDWRYRATKSSVLVAAVERWTELGESGRQIAERLRCSRRNVVRLRRVAVRRGGAG